MRIDLQGWDCSPWRGESKKRRFDRDVQNHGGGGEQKLFLLIKGSGKRGHRFKVICKRSKSDVSKTFSRVIWVWNSLPGNVVEAGLNKAFKRAFDDYLNRNNVQGCRKKASSHYAHLESGADMMGQMLRHNNSVILNIFYVRHRGRREVNV